ncbi:MAG: Hpt domain-containing protein [Solidesulfovibrio sp.]|uniref:Hpt domain-containing protein n=1 Tax=Solidesulfovibrio sp. TaxID=2910990 RepID=UPI002B1FB675|nr:Hpt domain-containing protein [Solidesulfovibrio sp.]MEA4855258.1 Hpt domain-containing protein [Solidesulfovibrio sp.]
MNPAEARRRAQDFLRRKQLLSAVEAEQALGVAAAVLGESLARLAAAAGARDGKTCAEAAHGLKGNLLNLGLPELAQAAQAIQDQAQTGDFQAVTTAISALGASLADMAGTIRD